MIPGNFRVVDGIDNDTIRANLRVHNVYQQMDEKEDGTVEPVWYIDYTPGGDASIARIVKKVDSLRPEIYGNGKKKSRVNDPHSAIGTMKRRQWQIMEPYILAAMKGAEVDVQGTKLSTWPGIDQRRADILRQNGIRTVEEFVQITESVKLRIQSQMPDMRHYLRDASLFLERLTTQESVREIKQRDDKISVLEHELSEMKAMFAELLDQTTAPKRGRPRKDGDKVSTETEAADEAVAA